MKHPKPRHVKKNKIIKNVELKLRIENIQLRVELRAIRQSLEHVIKSLQPEPKYKSMADLEASGWSFSYDPKPIPDRLYDWDFQHDNYDFCAVEGGNGLAGNGLDLEDCVNQANEIEQNNPFFTG